MMNIVERRIPTGVLILIAGAIAVGAMIAATLLLSGNHALGEGADSPAECTNADHPGIADTTFTAASGEIVDEICIKSGSNTFSGDKQHSQLITANGTYGNNDCFVVSGLGTSTVTVTLNPQASGCKDVSHIDVNTSPEPTPTPTPTATPTPTPTATPAAATATPTSTPTVLAATATPAPAAAVLGVTEAPVSLPVSGGTPEETTRNNLSLLLIGLGGLALLSGAGTLVAARRRR